MLGMATRTERIENYQAKRNASFACETCGKGDQLQVCEDDGDLVVRCLDHTGKLKVRPGQWKETAEKEAKAGDK
jgi:hypothetical protein